MITAPSVHLVFSTQIEPAALEFLDNDQRSEPADYATVFGGRACYGSWPRNFAPTFLDSDYIENAVHQQGHLSIAEHAMFSFYLLGVSRTLTHELVRHRHTSPSQLSQRYVDSTEMDWVCPIEYLDDEEEQVMVQQQFDSAKITYQELVDVRTKKLKLQGITGTEARKRARQAARSVLPGATETRLVLTGNCRAWIEAMGKRYDPAAEPEIQRLFGGHILPVLKEHAPFLFAHFELPEAS